MELFLPFFIILLAAILFGAIFEKVHLPWVVALIIAGMVIGPEGLSIVEVNPTIHFLGQAGLVFAMFMAGLETDLAHLGKYRKSMVPLVLVGSVVPFLAGMGIAFLFGYNLVVGSLLGIIFISSSVVIILPSLKANRVLSSKAGQVILSAIIIQDVLSLILLSVFLQVEQRTTMLPLWGLYPLLIVTLVGIRYLLPHIERILAGDSKKKDTFQKHIRAVFISLFGTVVLLEVLGLHSIIGAFFAGMVLAQSMKPAKILKQKLQAIGYGVFIPVFFVIVGMETKFSVLYQTNSTLLLTATIVIGGVIVKVLSSALGAKLGGLTGRQSLLAGVAVIPQLSTTLAATFTAKTLNLISEEVFTALIVLSIVTTLIGPTLMNLVIGTVIKPRHLQH